MSTAVAPILPQFVRSKDDPLVLAKRLASTNLDAVVQNGDSHDISNDVDEKAAPRTKNRGMNTSRRPPAPKIKRSHQLCPGMKLRDGHMCIGEKCIFEHDLEKFWSRKLPDLSAECHVFNVRGFCPDTFACRYSSAHTSAGSDIDKEILLSVKLRSGLIDGKDTAADIVEMLRYAPVDFFSVHGRSREQRYTKSANWGVVRECKQRADPVPVIGCGDVFSFQDFFDRVDGGDCDGVMIARGALIKPWIFTEIAERRHWDISATERMDILKNFVHYGLEQWGSDAVGVENCRKFLLEWLSFLHRYIPVGLLEVLPQGLNQKPPAYFGRNELETLFASDRADDWVRISEILLGKVPDGFNFTPKHKANSY